MFPQWFFSVVIYHSISFFFYLDNFSRPFHWLYVTFKAQYFFYLIIFVRALDHFEKKNHFLSLLMLFVFNLTNLMF